MLSVNIRFQLIYSVNNIFSNLSLERARLVKRKNTGEDDDRAYLWLRQYRPKIKVYVTPRVMECQGKWSVTNIIARQKHKEGAPLQLCYTWDYLKLIKDCKDCVIDHCGPVKCQSLFLNIKVT